MSTGPVEVVLMWLWLAIAIAAPPTHEIEVVPYEETQGTVRIVLEGRDGDLLRVDGMIFGHLPVETELVDGLHTFRVDGAKGRLEVQALLTFTEGQTTVLDLAAPKGPRAVEEPEPETVEPKATKPAATVQPPPEPAKDATAGVDP